MPGSCELPLEFSAELEEEGSWQVVRGTLGATKKHHSGCGGEVGQEVAYKYRAEQEGVLTFMIDGHPGILTYLRQTCRDADSGYMCVTRAKERRLIVKKGQVVYFIADSNSSTEDQPYELYLRLTLYAEEGEPCDPEEIESQCRFGFECTESEGAYLCL